MPTPEAPRRLVVMFTHFGCVTDRWFPQNSHGELSVEDFSGTTLDVLSAHVNKLLMPRGIRAMNQWSANMTTGQGNDQHLQVVGSYFTCAPVSPNSDDPFSFEPETKFQAQATAPSLDHVCARQINASRLPLVMRVGDVEAAPFNAISYSAPAEIYSGMGKPSEIYQRLTGLFSSTADMSPDTYAAIRGKNVLDLVRADLDTLLRYDMSMADRRKLDTWMDLLSETSPIVTSQFCNANFSSELDLSANALDLPESGDQVSEKVTGALDHADIYSHLAVLAMICDYSRVVLLKYPSDYLYEGLGLSSTSHAIAHRIANTSPSGCDEDDLGMIQTIDQFYARKFAHLLDVMEDVEEGEETLLDHTATVWFQELSDGNDHNLNNLPIIQAGSCGGYFKTGRAINVENGDPQLSRGRSTETCYPRDYELNPGSSGTPQNLANAPINKYYCSLMNALGVRAGADGFPQEGGTEEVTRFGRYDQTELFVGGDINPPTLVDPGEFLDLKSN